MSNAPSPPPRAPSALRWLKRSARAWWDALGLACSISLTVFGALVASVGVLGLWMRPGPVAAIVAALVAVMVIGPLLAGACWLVHRVLLRDESSYSDMWVGARRLYWQAAAVTIIDLGVCGALVVNTLFYLFLRPGVVTLLGIVSAYACVGYVAMCVYHYPLLVANTAGLICQEDGRQGSLRSVFRNSFVMALGSPIYTASVAGMLVTLLALFAVSGVGIALLGASVAAFGSVQAAHDQMVRFGLLPVPDDGEAPAPDVPWHV